MSSPPLGGCTEDDDFFLFLLCCREEEKDSSEDEPIKAELGIAATAALADVEELISRLFAIWFSFSSLVRRFKFMIASGLFVGWILLAGVGGGVVFVCLTMN